MDGSPSRLVLSTKFFLRTSSGTSWVLTDKCALWQGCFDGEQSTSQKRFVSMLFYPIQGLDWLAHETTIAEQNRQDTGKPLHTPDYYSAPIGGKGLFFRWINTSPMREFDMLSSPKSTCQHFTKHIYETSMRNLRGIQEPGQRLTRESTRAHVSPSKASEISLCFSSSAALQKFTSAMSLGRERTAYLTHWTSLSTPIGGSSSRKTPLVPCDPLPHGVPSPPSLCRPSPHSPPST